MEWGSRVRGEGESAHKANKPLSFRSTKCPGEWLSVHG